MRSGRIDMAPRTLRGIGHSHVSSPEPLRPVGGLASRYPDIQRACSARPTRSLRRGGPSWELGRLGLADLAISPSPLARQLKSASTSVSHCGYKCGDKSDAELPHAATRI